MTIDILYFLLILSAIYKGYTRGFIVSVFSFFAIIIGLAAAVKLSAIVAGWLRESTNISSQWLPFLSFVIVMVGIILLIRLAANMLQKTFEFMFMGWANKIGGILLYAVIYTMIFSVLLFFTNKIGILKEETISASVTYPFVEPWGIKTIDGFGKIIPVFKGMFTQLESFFDAVSKRAAK